MKVQVVYCNHRSANLQVREQLAFATDEQLGKAYVAFKATFPETEAVVLSTCNRVEVYTAHEENDEAPTQKQIAKFFADFHHIPIENFVSELLEQTGPEAVKHLYNVVTSLDSMVLGEPQIVSQVKEAYEKAIENEACGPMTNALFQGALQVSKRVRTETKLAEGRVSIASVAVGEFGKSIFDRFDDKAVLIIGAGEMAEETVLYLKQEGVKEITVANRNLERAEKLARECGGIAKPFDELDQWLPWADVIVSTTGADRPIIDVPRFQATRELSNNKPVFILDLGAPRDFDPDVGNIDDNVFLYDIDDLEATCDQNRKLRQKEVEHAERIVEEETERFMQDVYHRATGPIIKRLRELWHEIRLQEMNALERKLKHLSGDDLQTIERSIERIINKLLHPPLSTLRDEARVGPPHGLLDALKRLFHLGD